MAVIEHREGHRLANAVEQAKIACSSTGTAAVVDLSCAEPGLVAEVTPQALHEHLQGLLAQTVASALDCTRRAGLQPGQLDAVCLTGGSSALRPFREALQAGFAGVPLIEGDLFGGVASGLVYGVD